MVSAISLPKMNDNALFKLWLGRQQTRRGLDCDLTSRFGNFAYSEITCEAVSLAKIVRHPRHNIIFLPGTPKQIQDACGTVPQWISRMLGFDDPLLPYQQQIIQGLLSAQQIFWPVDHPSTPPGFTWL